MAQLLDDLDERQARIHRRLADLVSPGIATLFRDACHLLNIGTAENPPVKLGTHTHLVAHLLREIESALGRVLLSLANPATPPILTDRGAAREQRIRAALERAEIPPDVVDRAASEVTEAVAQSGEDVEGKTGHEQRVRKALRALKISESEPAGAMWIRLADPYTPYGLAGRAHRRALADPRPLDAEFLQFWEDLQAMLDRVLERLEVTFLPFMKRARGLAAATNPNKALLKALGNELPNDEVVFQEFFAHAGPAWASLLKQSGYFHHPPAAEAIDEGGSVRFPDWPQAEYLARVAPDRPAVIASVIADIRTGNVVIHGHLLAAALAMPAEHASRIVPAAKDWVAQPYKLFENRQYGRLIAHLADGGYTAAAMDLARAVLGVTEPEPSGDTPERRELSRWFRGPQARIGTWDYPEILREDLCVLARRDPMGVLDLLRDLPAEAIAIKRDARPIRDIFGVDDEADENRVRSGRLDDGSTIWFPDIEGGGTPDDVEEVLATALCRHAVSLADEDPARIPSLVDALEAGRWTVFHRIALHVLARHPTAAPDLVRDRVADADRFDDEAIRAEYDALAAAAFPHVEPSERELYLGRVEEGLTGVAWRAGGRAPEPADFELAEEHVTRWRYDRLTPVADHLDPEWPARFDDLRARVSEAAAARGAEPAVHAVQEVTLERALAMDPDELLSAIAAGHTEDGLVVPPRALAAVTEAYPEQYAEAAERFAGFPTKYRDAVMSGLLGPVRHGPAFGWGPALSLVQRVVTEADDASVTAEVAASLDAVADLLEHGLLERSAGTIPLDLRDLVWPMLSGLVRLSTRPVSEQPGADEDPTDAQGRMAHLGQRTIGLLIRYAFWMHPPAADDKAAAARPLAPEVGDALRGFLDLSSDAAPWVRAAFAREFPLLVSLDPTWAKAHRQHVFPPGDEHRAEFRRAWEAYLRNRAWGGVAPILDGEYARAVEDLAAVDDGEGNAPDGQRLAFHLMTLFYSGHVDLEEGGLLGEFFRVASSGLRRRALELLARGLYPPTEELADDRRDRLQAIWEHRLGAAEQDPGVAHELPWFGWWFASGKFPEVWSLDRLRRTLALTQGRVLRPRELLKRLATLSAARPTEAFECLRAVALGARGPEEIRTWWNDATGVLETAFSAGEPLRTAVIELVNRLSAAPYRFPAGGDWLSARQELDEYAGA